MRNSKSNPGFIFEFKKGEDESSVDKLAKKALDRIEKKRYDEEVKLDGVSKIIKVGIAFFNKNVKLESKNDFAKNA